MSFDVNVAWLVAVLLMSIRMGILFYATPFDTMGRLPAQLRVYLGLMMAVVLVNALSITPAYLPSSIVELGLMGLREVMLGLVMAFGFYCAMASIMVAGKLIDFQAGFGAAQILNPATNANSPLMGTVLSLLTVMIFFLSDAYLLAFKGIAYSLQIVPPGAGLAHFVLTDIVKQFSVVYVYGVIIAAPVIGVLMLLDTGIAVMGRTMPQMNVYFLFLPLKIGVALILTAASLRYLSPVLERLFLTVFEYWQRLLMSGAT